jgi:hypothetical protein
MKTVTTATKQIITGTTDKGKKCYAVLTDLRLSKDDFKALMADIRIAEGYGFTKYFAEYKKSLITAVNIEPELFASLCDQYAWNTKEEKETKHVATKAAAKSATKTKKTTKGEVTGEPKGGNVTGGSIVKEAKTAAINDMGLSPDMVDMFAKFKAFLSTQG